MSKRVCVCCFIGPASDPSYCFLLSSLHSFVIVGVGLLTSMFGSLSRLCCFVTLLFLLLLLLVGWMGGFMDDVL